MNAPAIAAESASIKRTYHINQDAIAALGLLDVFKPEHAMLLDWIRGWRFYPNANRITRDGTEFTWIDYKTAIEQNPMIFRRKVVLKTHINRMGSLIADLSRWGIILPKKSRTGRMYVHLTAKAQDLELVKVAAIPKPRDTAVPKIRVCTVKEEKVIEPTTLSPAHSVRERVEEDEFVGRFWSRICKLFPCYEGCSHRPPTKQDRRCILEIHRQDPITDDEIKDVEWFYREARARKDEPFDEHRIGFWADLLPRSPAALVRKWSDIHCTATQFSLAYRDAAF